MPRVSVYKKSAAKALIKTASANVGDSLTQFDKARLIVQRDLPTKNSLLLGLPREERGGEKGGGRKREGEKKKE